VMLAAAEEFEEGVWLLRDALLLPNDIFSG
jgi:hypothetical protein